MRALRFLNVAALSLLVAGSAALYAQDDKPRQDEARPETKQSEPRPEGKQDEMKPPKQDEAKPPKQDQKEQKQMEKQNEKQPREEMKGGHEEMKGGQAQARPAGKGGHIPDDRFHAQFGRSHKFVVRRATVVNGQSGFAYGGYTFVFVDPWPAEWAYTDDCYVDYIDGEYFLFDLMHPGLRIALFVEM